jgi:hypothetical protein
MGKKIYGNTVPRKAVEKLPFGRVAQTMRNDEGLVYFYNEEALEWEGKMGGKTGSFLGEKGTKNVKKCDINVIFD